MRGKGGKVKKDRANEQFKDKTNDKLCPNTQIGKKDEKKLAPGGQKERKSKTAFAEK